MGVHSRGLREVGCVHKTITQKCVCVCFNAWGQSKPRWLVWKKGEGRLAKAEVGTVPCREIGHF